MKAIKNGKIILKDKIVEDKVIVFDKNILDITSNIPVGIDVIDAKGKYISPGLIDIHIHGSGGADTMDASINSINKISCAICKNGVTSYLPTTMTMDKEDIYDAFEAIKVIMSMKPNGAKVLGAHMEGPFINEKYKGAQNSNYIVKPYFDFIMDYLDVIKIISLAPEVDKDFNFIKDIKNNTDIVLSICHSDADYELAKNAINLGITNITHMFNAMTPLNHRSLGVVGAALFTDVYCELICDEIHIHKDLFQFVLNNKGKDKLILITDSMRAGCLKDGKYDLGGQDVYVKDNCARLEDNTLAGSVLKLNEAVYNFYKNTNLNLNDVINLASLNPAKSINIDNKKGSLDIGKEADIAIFDEKLNCYMTIVEGTIVFNEM
jgi:N-acetylglucosamine-6-phosphate deacetylase